ncbi:uncharacterized protein LOC128963546 [Oppia nitens]|uniref:uncharacterized protein LOC128963546 n=1 Tax=Oppia nitens TaxID=1686743 RepID=UPI0023DCAADF|nr:uncharacterized protein LOC128963546 [Oppia nitens]
MAAQNSTYFTNPGFPSSYNNTNTCTLTIHRVPGVNKICQIRLDFMDFELIQPNEGNCDKDQFIVSGHNLNSPAPTICGFNSGQHMYLDVDGVQGPLIMNVRTDGPGNRRWNILVSQIECTNPSRAPPNCLQYLMGPTGVIMSFNYEVLQQTNINVLNTLIPTVSTQLSDWNYKGIGYMNDLHYSICFRKEQYFCTQTYSLDNISHLLTLNDQSFSINNTGVKEKEGEIGLTKCSEDYILLNGIRYCGYRLTSLGDNKEINGQITDDGSGPFIVKFITDNKISGRGFKLNYRQNPCINALQIPQTSHRPHTPNNT